MIYTIGHSTHPLKDFLDLLEGHEIAHLTDVRTVPRSRTNPQFNRETLPDALAERGIGYQHDPRLGGLRRARRDSPNAGWKNASFRGYADYMASPEFVAGLDCLVDTASRSTAVIMCAEALPWRCHRNLIADALLARGIQASHIMSDGKSHPHRLTSFARASGETVTYPRPEEEPA